MPTSVGGSSGAAGNWRIPRGGDKRKGEDAAAEGGGQAPSKKGGTGYRDAKGEDAEMASGGDSALEARVSAVERLSLKHDNEMREANGVLYDFVLASLEAPVSEEMIAEGIHYQEAVRRKKGHGLGSPHLHIAMRMVETLQDKAQSERNKLILGKWLTMAGKSRKLVNETFKCCRSKEAWVEDSKPKSERKCKIYYAIHPLADFEIHAEAADAMDIDFGGRNIEVTPRSLRRAIRETLNEMGAVEAEGQAPKSETARAVERNHRRARGKKR